MVFGGDLAGPLPVGAVQAGRVGVASSRHLRRGNRLGTPYVGKELRLARFGAFDAALDGIRADAEAAAARKAGRPRPGRPATTPWRPTAGSCATLTGSANVTSPRPFIEPPERILQRAAEHDIEPEA
jgi:hypothetical protein